ncbi:MAG: hypothetical protein E7612_09695 [Ruminococcaceae bacterium]|nr:hypothetical protein [Oscillospiraceae bacterium]
MFFQNARWIGLGDEFKNHDTGFDSPALQLRKIFNYDENGKVECLICGLGIYVLYINGVRVGKDVLAPAFTAYDRRTLYVKYDVSEYLKRGENLIAVKLGDGFYHQTTKDTWYLYAATWRNSPRLLLEFFENGNSVFASNETWKVTDKSATVHNAIRTGEFYDARKEDGWKTVDYDDSDWVNAKIIRSPGGTLQLQTMPNIREQEILKPVASWKSKNGWVYDFGKNVAGYAGIEMQGRSGETITLRYAEKLKGKEIDQSNVDFYVYTGEFATDRYTFKGEGVEKWKPDFVYHGFQYVEVSGVSEKPAEDSFLAYSIYTDFERIGNFNCSNELLSWTYRAGLQSFVNNFHGFITDCPQREKNGWLAGPWMSAGYGIFNFDATEAYLKFLQDVCDMQRPNGELPCMAPTSAWGYNWANGPFLDLVLFKLPFTIYEETGDRRAIEQVYPYVKKYLPYVASYQREDGTLEAFGLGDWRPPENIGNPLLITNAFSDSCCYYKILLYAKRMAQMMGEEELVNYCRDKASEIKAAIHAKYIRGDVVDNDSQGSLAAVLYFGVVEGEEAKAIAKKLADSVIKDNYLIKVGIIGLISLFNSLSDYGYVDVAYRMINQYEYPSLGYWMKQGATTIWESWLGDASRCHQMISHPVEWIIRNVGGLQNKGIAYDKCLIKPYFFDENCSAECSTRTPKGVISVSWEKKANIFTADIVLPQDCKATLELPNGEITEVQTGRYTKQL